ncbi:Sodium/hydrogen exchanger family-domain-containing protein [Xylaria arbuscula]|nr:Sodium/hydrogen exchanger family-domain-containing protein [Xylaria arbuscula]
MAEPSYLSYHEPSLVELLISSTFLLALNTINSVLDRTLACGLVGQVLLGTAWGQPGARWISLDFQRVVTTLGYIGLILVVYAGGLETDLTALRKNLFLSIAVAITGVVVPIGLSFATFASSGSFLGTASGGALLLPAFAAGAALCSTSLGTTFSVLQASGLSRTRLGAVLASAALLDDVVGLVMVRIITSLGQAGNSGIQPETIVRPVLVSVAFAVIVPLVCRYALKPARGVVDRVAGSQGINDKEEKQGDASKRARVRAWAYSPEAAFIFQTAFLILLVVAADYAGTSVLLAAYLAGAVVSWWDGQKSEPEQQPHVVGSRPTETPSPTGQQMLEGREPDRNNGESPADIASRDTPTVEHMAARVFDRYYAQALNRVLKPFFFASIGFSIPISKLFTGQIVWRGIIYTILMLIGKLVCGLWLVRLPMSVSDTSHSMITLVLSKYNLIVSKIRRWGFASGAKSKAIQEPQTNNSPSAGAAKVQVASSPQPNDVTPSSSPNSALVTPPKPISLYPAAVMGCAMVARGEIGFLISSMAESQGVFRQADEDPSEASEFFLIVTWAIFLCTIIGPVCTGLLVRRIKKLEKASGPSRGGGRNVLGVWGF